MIQRDYIKQQSPCYERASQSTVVKNLPANARDKMQETGVRSLGQEDPREKGMATHSSILAGRAPWRQEPGRLESRRYKELDMTEHACTMIFRRGETLTLKAIPYVYLF